MRSTVATSLRNHPARSTVFALAALAIVAPGCAGDAGEPESPVEPAPAAQSAGDQTPFVLGNFGRQREATLGEYRATYSAATKKLSIERLREAPTAPGAKPQGFGRPNETATVFMDYATVGAQIGATCGDDAGENTVDNPCPSLTTACSAGKFCSMVKLTNNLGRNVDEVYVEVYSLTPAGYEATNSDAPPTDYGLSASKGLWSYGALANGASGTKQWDFGLPGTEDFSFLFRIKATFLRTSYTLSTTNNATFIDACAMSGATTGQLKGVTADTLTATKANIKILFPFTTYGSVDYSAGNPLTNTVGWVSVNGVFGFGQRTGSGTNGPLPDANLEQAFFPFWDDLETYTAGSRTPESQICYGTESYTESTVTNRRFVVTWQNVGIEGTAGAENLNFSVVLYEHLDRIDYLYNKMVSSQNTNASPNNRTRGSSATIGMQAMPDDPAAGFCDTATAAKQINGVCHSVRVDPGNGNQILPNANSSYPFRIRFEPDTTDSPTQPILE